MIPIICCDCDRVTEMTQHGECSICKSLSVILLPRKLGIRSFFRSDKQVREEVPLIFESLQFLMGQI